MPYLSGKTNDSNSKSADRLRVMGVQIYIGRSRLMAPTSATSIKTGPDFIPWANADFLPQRREILSLTPQDNKSVPKDNGCS